jgi:hypothetical protein
MTTSIFSVHTASRPVGPSAGFRRFCVAVVAVQGVHVFEHVVQLFQVHHHSKNTLGLLGYVFMFQGTAEWMHLVFNVAYMVALYIIAIGLRDHVRLGSLAPRPYAVFLVFGVALETWHSIEHAVIVKHIIENDGCPCPGILDPVLGVMDAQLHFGYNAVAYAGTIVPFIAMRRSSTAPRR